VISVPQTEIAGSRRTPIIEEEEEEKEAEKEEEGQEEGETQDESSHADVYDGQYRDYDLGLGLRIYCGYCDIDITNAAKFENLESPL